jgi:hypothetical protein
MGEMTLVRSHVERCLQDIWDQCRVHRDHDGDYPFTNGTASGFVRIDRGDPVVIRVWAFAVVGIERSGKLLKELNDINARCRTASVTWHHGAVIVSQVIHAGGVTRKTLRQAIESVGFVADDIGGTIAAVYGGGTPVGVNADAHPHRESS